MVGYQLFNCRLRAAVFPHPPGGGGASFLHVSERRFRIFSDVPLDISFEGRRVQSAGEDVPQHGVGEGVRSGGVGLRPQEAKAGGVLSNGFGEPLLPSKKRPCQAGGVSVFSPILLEDIQNLCGGINVFCSHGENFLLGMPLERAQEPAGCNRVLHGLELEIQLCLSDKILGVTLVTGEPA